MGSISTDVISLAAVLGSAAVAGVITLALADRPTLDLEQVEAVYECATTVVETAPRAIHIDGRTHEGKRAVVVGSNVTVRTEAECAAGVGLTEVQLARLHAELERAGAELEGLHLERLRLIERELQGMEGLLERELDALDGEALERMLEGELRGLDRMIEAELAEKLEAELARMEERLERVDRERGR